MSEQIVNLKRDRTAQLEIAHPDGRVDTVQLNPQGRTTLPEGWYVTDDSVKRNSFVHIPKEYRAPVSEPAPKTSE